LRIPLISEVSDIMGLSATQARLSPEASGSYIRFNAGVFARLRSFAFDILKANRTGSLSQDRYRVALGGFKRLSRLANIER